MQPVFPTYPTAASIKPSVAGTIVVDPPGPPLPPTPPPTPPPGRPGQPQTPQGGGNMNGLQQQINEQLWINPQTLNNGSPQGAAPGTTTPVPPPISPPPATPPVTPMSPGGVIPRPQMPIVPVSRPGRSGPSNFSLTNNQNFSGMKPGRTRLINSIIGR